APPILDRRSWGGNRLPPKEAPIYGVVHAGFVHHTVTANNYAPSDSRSIVLAICHYHRDHNGWNDIGYNFLVDKYGQIFEGRDGGIDQAVIGAQAQGYNSSSTGVSCLGDYTSLGFTKPGLEAVAQLLAYKLPLHGVPVKGKVTVTSQGGADNRYRSGARVRLDRISGHRDGDATTCPGNGLYRQLAGLRDRTDQLAVPLSGLTIRAAQTELRYPAPLDLAGGLRFEDESSAAGAPIQVQYQPRGGSAWQVLQTLPARGDGTFATEVPLPTSGRVRAVFPGDLTRAVVDGSPIDVTVVPGLALTLSPRRPPVGSATTVAGTVTPAGPKRARLTVERRVGSRYLPVSRRKVQVSSDGAVDTTFRPSRPGLYRVSLSVGGATARRFVRAV
ncbi:MAG: N-acetylmuramoyl-L-alanine amidase, partial [Solirubrobacteraceae bacterium]